MKRLFLALAVVAAVGLASNLALADGPSHGRIPVTTAVWTGGHSAPVTPVWWYGGYRYYGGYYGYPGVAVTTPYYSYYSGPPAVTYSPYPSYGYTVPYYGYYGGYRPYRYYGAYRPYYGWRR
jgi:hypothetical protein